MDGKGLVLAAKDFAEKVHAGQMRGGKIAFPAINHMREVAGLVEWAGGDFTEIAAAWLHDTVEDTSTTLVEIKTIFGPAVASIVDGLTDPTYFATLPFLLRKIRQADRIFTMGDSVKLVKISDQISNVVSITSDAPVEWDGRRCIDYCVGAFAIARICAGVSPCLDEYFLKVFSRTMVHL
ncbi:MAG: HD domain-containing protein [bacterium]|nr:HD domain-containing protein [bacterium]